MPPPKVVSRRMCGQVRTAGGVPRMIELWRALRGGARCVLSMRLVILGCEPGGIPARSGEARDETEPYGVGDDRHDDRDCGRRLLGGHGCLAARDDDVHLQADQVGGEAWDPFVSSLRPPVLDADVLPFDVAKLAEPLLERFDKWVGRRTAAEYP